MIKDHNIDLTRWQNTYNTVRPHQALGYQTRKISSLTG